MDHSLIFPYHQQNWALLSFDFSDEVTEDKLLHITSAPHRVHRATLLPGPWPNPDALHCRWVPRAKNEGC